MKTENSNTSVENAAALDSVKVEGYQLNSPHATNTEVKDLDTKFGKHASYARTCSYYGGLIYVALSYVLGVYVILRALSIFPSWLCSDTHSCNNPSLLQDWHASVLVFGVFFTIPTLVFTLIFRSVHDQASPNNALPVEYSWNLLNKLLESVVRKGQLG